MNIKAETVNTQTQNIQPLTTSYLKEVRAEFAKLKPEKVTLDGNRKLTIKEAIFSLAPTLERMKKRGFDNLELAEKLHAKGIGIKPPTLAKYLNEFRRKKDSKKDTAPQVVKTKIATTMSDFSFTEDTPLDEL